MEYTIYHGSKKIIKKPEFGKGKPYNDYGLGFYCTEDINMAREWAAAPLKPLRNGYVNCYKINCDGLNILDLNDDKFCLMNWFAVLLENRIFHMTSPLAVEAREYILKNFLVNYKDFDIIIGYRADDSYFSFAQDFLNGAISYRQLGNAMRFGNLGQQFVVKSKDAFAELKFESYEAIESGIWTEKYKQRDLQARHMYFDSEKNKRQKEDIYILHILEKGIGADDTRLR